MPSVVAWRRLGGNRPPYVRHARADRRSSPGHPRRAEATASVTWHTDVDGRDKPGHDGKEQARGGSRAAISHGEVLGLRVVADDGRGRLLGVELVFVGHLDADAAGAEQVEEARLVGEVGAGGVAEGVARAAIAL